MGQNIQAFLVRVGIIIDVLLLWFIRLTEGINYSRPYKLDWKKILMQFEQSKMNAYDFSVYFTFEYHEKNDVHDDFDSKLFMQRDIYEGLMARRKNRPLGPL